MGTKESRYISSDTHIYEPADLWTSRMRGKFADKAPYLDSRPEGDYYMIDGVDPQPCGSAGANLQQKIEKGEVGWRPARHEGQDGAREEAGNPKLRLNDQDLDNVRAEIIYPNQWELNIYNAPDAEYAQACAEIYNDWLAEFCAVAPDRLIGAALLTTKGPIEWSIAEAKRVAKKGFRTVHIPVDNVEHPYAIPGYYEEFWATLQDLGLVVACHVTSTTVNRSRLANFPPGTPLGATLAPLRMMPQTIGAFVGGGICQSYPDLKIVMVECGIGWIPSVLTFMDKLWVQLGKKMMQPRLDEPPSYYFKRQMYATFEEAPEDVAAIQFIPADCFLWGNDYPHIEGTFPGSKELLNKNFAGFPEEVVRKVTQENAAQLYGI